MFKIRKPFCYEWLSEYSGFHGACNLPFLYFLALLPGKKLPAFAFLEVPSAAP